jgi:hypothetical protein
MKFHVIDGRRCEVKKAVTREQMDAMKYILKPGELTALEGHMPAVNYGSLASAAGFMPGTGGNASGFWAPGVNVDHDSGSFLPAAATCAAMHADYGTVGAACASCGHGPAAPKGITAFANRHPGPQMPPSRAVAPSPARHPMAVGGRGRKFTVLSYYVTLSL